LEETEAKIEDVRLVK